MMHVGWKKPVAWRAEWLGDTCRRGLRLINTQVVMHGKPQLDAAMVVANHVSYLDILVFADVLSPVFVSKSEVKSWPLFGFFAKLSSTIFVEREKRSKVLEQASELERIVKTGTRLVLFPEGTTTNGDEILNFRSSLFEPVVKNQWVVVPAAFRYRCKGGDPRNEVYWWGDATLAGHLALLLQLDVVRVDVVFGSAMARVTERKQLAVELREKVLALKAQLDIEPPTW